MDGGDVDSEGSEAAAEPAEDNLVRACLSAMAVTAGAAVEGMGGEAGEATVAAQTGSLPTDGPGG